MKKLLIAAAFFAAAFAMPAQADPVKIDKTAADAFFAAADGGWLENLTLQPPTIVIEDEGQALEKATAAIVVVNNGTTDSKAIKVECVLLDGQENHGRPGIGFHTSHKVGQERLCRNFGLYGRQC